MDSKISESFVSDTSLNSEFDIQVDSSKDRYIGQYLDAVYGLINFYIKICPIESILKENELDRGDKGQLLYIICLSKDDYKWEIIEYPNDLRNELVHIKKKLLKEKKISISCSFVSKLSEVEDISAADLTKNNCNDIITRAIENLSKERLNEIQSIIWELFHISQYSFLSSNSMKPFEGYVEKEAEPRKIRTVIKVLCNFMDYLFFKQWNKRWIVLKEDMLFYANSNTPDAEKYMYYFDNNFKVCRPYNNNILQISNAQRNFILRFKNNLHCKIWEKKIKEAFQKRKNKIENNIYKSFTDEKSNNCAKFFVDGENYFSTVREQLLNAKTSVYITDWWLSPELFLKRPVNIKDDVITNGPIDWSKPEEIDVSKLYRVVDIIHYISLLDVRVYILVYKEVEAALTLNSRHTKLILDKLNDKVKVTRHPRFGGMDILWSHHEKLVVIDEKIAFVGGLDLCWGRFDTNKHPIIEAKRNDGKYMFPFIDYSNARINDFTEVQNFQIENVNREKYQRMPWHDVHVMLEGKVVQDISRHFTERWNSARFQNRNYGLYHAPNKDYEKKKSNISNISVESESDIQSQSSISSTNSFNNTNTLNKVKTFAQYTPRISIDTIPDNISNLNQVNKDSSKVIVKSYITSFLKKISSNYSDKENIVFQASSDFQQNQMKEVHNFNIQALRSCSSWSIGFDGVEHSILNAYYHLITNAKHYIYIENQFFVSKSYTEEENKENLKTVVKNKIALKIIERIEKAIDNNENFKVFLCIPLLPGFAGSPTDDTLSVILKHTFAGLCRNKGLSIIEKINKKCNNPNAYKKYIIPFSLRGHGLLNNKPKTELIYIHSKLMIVDDRQVIIGSANINDRSMLGSRDSEFAVLISQKLNKKSKMNGEDYECSEFASNFRKTLMAEHLGIDINDEVLIDPVSYELNKLIEETKATNTFFYRELFHCYPDDTITNEKELRTAERLMQEDVDLKRYIWESKKVKGHIVDFPLEFMKDYNFGLSGFSKESMLPESNYT